MRFDCQAGEGIQGINDLCFDICSAYSDSQNVYEIDPMCEKTCQELVEMRRNKVYGVGRCDHQWPARGIPWNQTGNYVPQLLKQGYTPEEAKNKCFQLCDKNYPTLSAQCREKCVDHYNSIEDYRPIQNSSVSLDSVKTDVKKHPYIFWATFIIVLAILGAIVYKTMT